MGIHHKSWEGLNILIFGREPQVPARLRNQIVTTTPDYNVLLQSFGNYKDAFEYSKSKKDIGLLLILESNTTPSTEDIARNLLTPYRQTGWPAFAFLIHNGTPTVHGYSHLIEGSEFLDYFSEEEFAKPDSCRLRLKKIWNQYTMATENFLLSSRFKTTLIDKQIAASGSAILTFRNYISNILRENLVLSWKENFCIDWSSAIDQVNRVDPTFFKSHGDLLAITRHFRERLPQELNSKSLSVLATGSLIPILNDSKLPLANRVVLCTDVFCSAFADNQIESFLQPFIQENPAQASDLVKNVIRGAHSIKQFVYTRGKAA